MSGLSEITQNGVKLKGILRPSDSMFSVYPIRTYSLGGDGPCGVAEKKGSWVTWILDVC